MSNQTINVKGCTMDADYTWNNVHNCILELNELTLNDCTLMDILAEGVTLEMVLNCIAENHVNEEPFEE
jgi:hypothetical protein